MKAIIESKYKVRDRDVSSYYSFPVYSKSIEETLIRELEFHKRCKHPFSLELRIVQE